MRGPKTLEIVRIRLKPIHLEVSVYYGQTGNLVVLMSFVWFYRKR